MTAVVKLQGVRTLVQDLFRGSQAFKTTCMVRSSLLLPFVTLHPANT